MTDLELTRTADDRRRYQVAGVGTLGLEGFWARSATAEAGGRRWRFSHRGRRGRIEAADDAGGVVGDFEPRTWRGGGTVRWGTRELALRPASRWRERYALADGDRELVLLDGKGWGKRPVRITTADAEVDAGLLLFAAFIVHGLAAAAAAAAG